MSPSRVPRAGAPTTAEIVPGSLARVRADAQSRFAGRSGLVVAVDAGVATIRFGGARGHSFALADLQPVASFTATSTSPAAGALLRPRSATGRQPAPPSRRPAGSLPSSPRRPSPPSAPGTRTRARAGGESSSLEPRRRSNRKVTDARH